MPRVYIGLGSNLGDRARALQQAAEKLCALQGVSAVFASPVFACRAHTLPGQSPQPDFLNAVCRLDTTLGPHELLGQLQQIERSLGRDLDAQRWSARPIDLDLIVYGDQALEWADLVVPHPRLGERAFWLEPLAQLDPDLTLPDGRHVEDLRQNVSDGSLTRVPVVLKGCPAL
jgi:2-amino-4-hydroxy-6-hydroxymethyldihydropteridine diphosphokinase